MGWYWGVQHGLAENNRIEGCPIGISIGHRDTHNTLRGNSIRRCTQIGLQFRDDPPDRAAHFTRVEDNQFEDIGAPGAPGWGIDLRAPVRGCVLRGNRFVCTRPGLMRGGIRTDARTGPLELDNNRAQGLKHTIEKDESR